MIPAEPEQDLIATVLRNDRQLTQTLIITKRDVPEETHGDLLESFLILKGECICKVGDDTHHLLLIIDHRLNHAMPGTQPTSMSQN